jgi:hypothetical protein
LAVAAKTSSPLSSEVPRNMTILPLGVADFAELRQRGCLYVDKTRLLYELVKTRRPIVLSRPRGFGKTLMVSALEAILRGRRELFEGLWIDGSDYDWTPYPVISLSMSTMATDSVGALEKSITLALGGIAEREGLTLQSAFLVSAFMYLIEDLHDKYHQKVAILIDDYDAPILKHVADPDRAEEIREALADFYEVLEFVEVCRGFALTIGVGQFAVRAVVSDVSEELTLDDEYAAICGFTIEEFDSLFHGVLEDGLKKFKSEGSLPEEATVADLMERILALYGGYSWDGETRVLNPWSVLGCLKKGKLSNFWFQSDSPAFLVNLIKREMLDFEYLREDYGIFDTSNYLRLNKLDPTTVMFQTGYLTVKSRLGWKFALDYPNLEVRASLLPRLMSIDRRLLARPIELATHAKAMLDALRTRDAEGLAAAFSSFLANIPFILHRPKEAFSYAAFLLAMALAGRKVDLRTSSVDGGTGVIVAFEDSSEAFVMEFKYSETKEGLEAAVAEAMTRIEETFGMERTEPDRGSRGRPPRPPKAPGSPKAPKNPKS